MTNDSITTVLSVVAWGTKLTFGLYDFAVQNAFSPASGDVSRLAKEVNLLSQVLRQIGSRLKEDGSLPSPEAFNVVRAILDQCQDVFREIESLVPLGQQSRPGSYDGSSPSLSRPGSYDGGASPQSSYVMVASPLREEVDWSAAMQARANYLLAHLEALKLTMSVMLQTLYTAKAIVWARYDNHRTAYEAVDVEKLQTESLVIEQQLALFRAYRLHDNFRWQISNTSQLQIEASPQSQALIKRDSEGGPSPRALMPYQEPSLAMTRPSGSELEDLPRIRMISSPYVEMLLSRWSRMHYVEERLHLEQAPRDERRREKYQRRNWQAPTMESDSEEDEDVTPGARRPPKLNLQTHEPVLMHVDESKFVSSPMSAVPRLASLQPPGGPFSPQPSNSWGPTSGSYFPQSFQNVANGSNTSRRRVVNSPGPSPLASPRVSFSSDGASNPVPRVQTAFKVDGSQPQPPMPSSRTSAPQPSINVQGASPQPPQPREKDTRILYRLRINQWYWDYADGDLLSSNQRNSPQAAIKTVSKDTQAITEIFREYVSREALRKQGLEYQRVPRKRIVGGAGPGGAGVGGFEVEEECYCIEGALRPEDVQKLVERSRKIRGLDVEDKPKASRSQPPPLDRSNTAPVYGNKFRDAHPKEVAAATAAYSRRDTERSNTSNSNTSDEDSFLSPNGSNYKTSSRPRSKSRHRHDSPRGYDDRDESYYKEKDRGSHRSRSRGGDKYSSEKDKDGKRKSGSAKMQTATKIAAGAGLATLLDGLPEMLSYL